MSTFDTANQAVDEVYKNLYPIINEVVEKYAKESDQIIKKVGANPDTLSKEELRKYILKLSSEAYILNDVKERAGLRRELAEMLYKENVAKIVGSTSGTQKDKDSAAIIASTSEKMAELLHSRIESQLKTKILGINNVIENLKSVLISRISEDKNIS